MAGGDSTRATFDLDDLRVTVAAIEGRTVCGLRVGDLARFAFSGTSAQIIGQTEALLAARAGRVEFGTPHGLTARDGLRLLGERVLPALPR